MKIAILTPTYFPTLGGVQTGVHHLALQLARRGHEVTVVGPFGALRSPWLRGLPYRVHCLPPFFFRLYRAVYGTPLAALLSRVYAEVQRRYGFDLWQVCYAHPAGTSLLPFASVHGIPYVVRCVGADLDLRDPGRESPELPPPPRQQRAFGSYRQMPAFVAISQTVHDALIALGVPDGVITRIPNGLDMALFHAADPDRAAWRSELGIAAGQTMVLTVCRNVPSKNLACIVRVAALLLEGGRSDFRFVLAGPGMPRFRASIPARLQPLFVCLPGFGVDTSGPMPAVPHRRLVDLYASADIFLLPTLRESFGIAFIEAMAAGLPVLGADVAGCRDVVIAERNGYLPHPDDVRAYADRLILLSAGGDAVAAMRQRNRSDAAAYDWERIADRYVQLYEGLLAGGERTCRH